MDTSKAVVQSRPTEISATSFRSATPTTVSCATSRSRSPSEHPHGLSDPDFEHEFPVLLGGVIAGDRIDLAVGRHQRDEQAPLRPPRRAIVRGAAPHRVPLAGIRLIASITALVHER